MKNRLHRYNINRPSFRTSYSKYKKCLTMMMLICFKQDLSNIWSSIYENANQAKLKKSVAFKKKDVCDRRHI